MSPAARAALLVGMVGLLSSPRPGSAAEERLVIVFLVGGLSYEDALAQPALRALAARGGIGLMTTPSDRPMDNSGYLSMGAGSVIEGSEGPVRAELREERVQVDPRRHVLDSGDGLPGALAESLAEAGFGILYVGEIFEPETVDAPGLLMAMDPRGRAVHPLHVDADSPEFSGVLVFDAGREPGAASETGASVQTYVSFLAAEMLVADRVLLIVASPDPSAPMLERGDLASPLIVAEIRPREVLEFSDAQEPPRGMTSSTTRRGGVVSVADVAPTILEFLGVPVPAEMTGSPIRIEGDAPTALHARFLGYQRARVPVQTAALALLLAAAAAALLLLLVPAPARLRQATALVGIAAASIPIALLAAGYLPTFSYTVLVPSLVESTAAITMLAWWLGRGDPTRAFIVLAWTGLAALVVDAAFGWRGMLLSLLGGDALRGVRFYGLSNPYAGFLLSAALLAATRLPLRWGAALLVAAAVLGAAPILGANLGAGITLAAAAGLWVAVQTRKRLGLRELAIGAGAAVAGLAVFLAWHALSPEPTHVTRVAAEAGRSGPGALAATAGRRLEILVRNTTSMPAAWLAVAGLPFGLAIAWRKARPFRQELERDPQWRWGVAVLALSGMVGFLVNDTSSTAAVAFAYVGLGLLFPSLEARWKIQRLPLAT